MSSSVYSLIDGARARLGRVRAQSPSEDDVLREVSSHLRHFLNTLNNTSLAWDYRTLTLTVDANQASYQIPDTSFGKPFAVLTRDDSNPSHVVRRVPFFEAPNMHFNWEAPGNVGAYVPSFDGSNHTAQRAAFFWADGFAYVSFLPTPQTSADYDISFSVGDATRSMSLDTVPVLSQYHDLIEVRAARSLLPLCEWWDNEERNERKRRELALSLTADEQLYNQQFLAAATMKNAGAGISWRYNNEW